MRREQLKIEEILLFVKAKYLSFKKLIPEIRGSL
jgi:hypothetical protein